MASNFDDILNRHTRTSDAGVGEILRSGDALFGQGQYQQALRHFLVALKQQPDVPEHRYRVGLGLWRIGRHDEAKLQFQEAILLKPDFAQAHGELGRVLLAMGQIERATTHARRAVDLAPQNPELVLALASVLVADRQSDAAFKVVSDLIASGYETTDVALVYARLAPPQKSHGAALGLITRQLKKEEGRAPRSASALHFAAAGLLDGLGRYDEAFEHAAAANALRDVTYDRVHTERTFGNWIDFFTRPRLGRLARATHGSELPVFIVGMPRSGTSLVEQILASHPAVHGAGELDWISRLCESAKRRFQNPRGMGGPPMFSLQRHGRAARATGPEIGAKQRGAQDDEPTMQCLERLTVDDVNQLASQYLVPLRALDSRAVRITDKMPENFIFLGLIAMLFPKARVIHCRRDKLDTCLSCYMTDFTAGHEFSFSLPALGHFHRQYERLMSHWKSVLDVPTLEVDYEVLVSDVEGQSRRMVEFLGLPWDDRCLRFHENKRFVGTASNPQVRLPVYTSSAGRWRNYEKHLAPLRVALG